MPLMIKSRQNARDDAEKQTIEMVAISSVVPLIPNMNVGENERLSFTHPLPRGGADLMTRIKCDWEQGPINVGTVENLRMTTDK